MPLNGSSAVQGEAIIAMLISSSTASASLDWNHCHVNILKGPTSDLESIRLT